VTTTSLDGGDQGGGGEWIITVQIIAASAVVRAGLAALIGADERFQVLGSFPTAREAQAEIERTERPLI
jgi:DNA-binding NarL/FixJ family response regulator